MTNNRCEADERLTNVRQDRRPRLAHRVTAWKDCLLEQ